MGLFPHCLTLLSQILWQMSSQFEKKEPCSCPCTSTPRTFGLRTSHESSSPLLSVQPTAHFTDATLTHNIPTSEPRAGELPLASCHEQSTISKPPYLKPGNA